jgi:hypothetical protein
VKGSLTEGKYADLVVLSDNPLTIPENELVDLNVLITMVGGQTEFTADSFDTGCLNQSSSIILSVPILIPLMAIMVIYIHKGGKRN